MPAIVKLLQADNQILPRHQAAPENPETSGAPRQAAKTCVPCFSKHYRWAAGRDHQKAIIYSIPTSFLQVLRWTSFLYFMARREQPTRRSVFATPSQGSGPWLEIDRLAHELEDSTGETEYQTDDAGKEGATWYPD